MLSIGDYEYFTLNPLGLFARKREEGKMGGVQKQNVFAKRKPSFRATLRVQIMSAAL